MSRSPKSSETMPRPTMKRLALRVGNAGGHTEIRHGRRRRCRLPPRGNLIPFRLRHVDQDNSSLIALMRFSIHRS